MSYIKCTKCGGQEFKDFSNPNIHYSIQENDTSKFKCSHCLNFESLKVGDWYQTSDGKYHQKISPENKPIAKANEKFKQQIINAYNEGALSVVKDAEKYYSKTFKSE
jgi:hypothetical protein